MRKKDLTIKIEKDKLRVKPRHRLKATKVFKNKKKYDRKRKVEKD